MVPFIPQWIHFPSHFLVFFTKDSDYFEYFLNVVKYLKGNLQKI